jgi:hypothetical protein
MCPNGCLGRGTLEVLCARRHLGGDAARGMHSLIGAQILPGLSSLCFFCLSSYEHIMYILMKILDGSNGVQILITSGEGSSPCDLFGSSKFLHFHPAISPSAPREMSPEELGLIFERSRGCWEFRLRAVKLKHRRKGFYSVRPGS